MVKNTLLRGSTCKGTILSFLIVLSLFVTSIIPIYAIGNSITTTLSSGDSESDLLFPPNGGEGAVDFSFPYGSVVNNQSLAIEGLPNGATGHFNDSTYDDFNASFRKGLVLENDSVHIEARSPWWNLSWYYRLNIIINSSARHRENITPSLNINLTPYIDSLNILDDFDINSLRVVEYNASGGLIKFNQSIPGNEAYPVPYYLIESWDYNSTSAVNFTLTWICKGIQLNNTERYFSIYFDTLNRPKSPPSESLLFMNDIAFANQAPTIQNSFVYLSNGTGFDPIPDYLLPTLGANRLLLDDLNQDGYIDAIIANSGTGFFNSKVNSYVYLNGPNGIDSTADILLPTVGAYAVATHDLNKDGYIDIVFANNHDGNDYSIDSYLFWGSINGYNATFDLELNTTGASDVGIGDFNNDGWSDIAFSSFFDGSNFEIDSLIFNGGASGFNYEPDVNIPTKASFGCAVNDLNNDKVDDLVFANFMDDTYSNNQNNTAHFGSPSGISTSPDLLIRGEGAVSIELADLDMDGRTDFIVGNSFNGASGDIVSYIYYYNSSNIYQNPDVLLESNSILDMAIEDIDVDGDLDIAFANYEKAGNSNTNSFVYLADSTGYSSLNRILLPTKGAAGVEIGELDRYCIDTDSTPPTFIIVGIENKYFNNSFMVSPLIETEDDILSVVVTWGSNEPSGSELIVQITNDGGQSWKDTNLSVGTIFDNSGRDLMYRIDFSTNSETPILYWIDIAYNMGNYPTNVTLDIGGDGSIDWAEPGTFNYTFNLNTTGFMDEITENTSPYRYYPWEFITVPFVFTSETSGIIHIYGINITHNSPPFLNATLPEFELPEDTATSFPVDLDGYFMDMDNDVLGYSTAGESNINVTITDDEIVITPDPDWNGEDNITLYADDGDGGRTSERITVTVLPVNDPPVPAIQFFPANVSSMEVVTFDGSGSSDIDGVVQYYQWDFGDGAFAIGPNVTHRFSGGNTGYQVNLTVIDDGGASGTKSVTVSVGNAPPKALVNINDPTGQGFDTFTDVTIDTTGTMDEDGAIDRFVLDFGDGDLMSHVGAPPQTINHQYIDGTFTYSVTLRVWDDNNISASATAIVNINNVGPKILMVSAPSSIGMGETVKFRVDATDEDGGVANYLWDFNGDGNFNWSSNLNGNATHKYQKTGKFRASLKVLDDDGAATFYTVEIEVKETQGQTDLGLVIGLGIALLIVAIILSLIILQQRGVIMRQKDLLVKRDEALREIQLEQDAEMETTREEELDRIAPTKGEAEEEDIEDAEVAEEEDGSDFEDLDEEDEDLGTLEPMDDEPPEADDIMTPDTGKTTIEPSDSTGILPSKPAGLGDMMGAAQATPALGVAETTDEEEEEEAEVDEPKEVVLEKEPVEKPNVVAKARCPGCKSVIPLYSTERPMRIKCDSCGKEGVIK